MLRIPSDQQINNEIIDNARLEMTKSSDNTPLQNYVIGTSVNGCLKKHIVDEFVKTQRDRIHEMNTQFCILENTRKIEHSVFITAKIEHVVSPREFYVVPVHDLEAKSEFQNALNSTYQDDFEPIENIKVGDLCVTMYHDECCRARVVEILSVTACKRRIFIYLLDNGRTIRTKLEKLGMLSPPHHAISPFAIKCNLTVLNDDEDDLTDDLKQSITQKFEQFSKKVDQVALYVNRPSNENQKSYDVVLLTQEVSQESNNSSAYLIHETYAAFSSSCIQFNDKICEKWAENIHQIVSDSRHTNDTKNCEVVLSCIVSPSEIYAHCKKTRGILKKIRQKIDAYITSHGYDLIHVYENKEWSIGENCFVRLQNWNVKSNLKQWFRGKIVKENPNNGTFTVFLRDYGMSTETTCIDLMPIPLEFSTPANAVQRCNLNISNDWMELNTKTLQKIAKEYRYFSISCSSKVDSCLNVALWGTNYKPNINEHDIWDNIGLMLISQSIKESMQNFIQKTQLHYSKHKYRSDDSYDTDSDIDESFSAECELLKNLSFEQPVAKDMKESPKSPSSDTVLDIESIVYRWQRPIPLDTPAFHGYVTHVNPKGIIYIQEDSFTNTAIDLTQMITSHVESVYKSYKVVKNYTFKENGTCFASWDSETYQRAVIKKIDRENGICTIKFVDYGYMAIAEMDDLYPATKFGDIPILAHRLYVPRLVPGNKNGKWCRVIIKEFRKRLINKMCQVSIDGNYGINNILPCSIEPDDLPCNIYKWMFKTKLGYIPNAPGAGLNEDGQDFLYV